VISDRRDRRAIVIATQVISGVFAVGLALLTFAGAATELHVIATAFALQTSWAVAKRRSPRCCPRL
jgi:hypothetical protein